MSKKIIILVIIVIILGGIIGYTLTPKEEKNKISNTISKITESIQTNPIVDEELTFITTGKSNNYENGYYYIDSNENSNIKYFDYATKKEIYLCNKPNCNHDTDKCSSYLEIGENREMFIYNNYIYLTNSNGSTTTINATMGDDGAIDMTSESGKTPTIYRMNLDGTNKEKLFECPSGVELASSYVLSRKNMYTCFSKSKLVEIGRNSHASVETEKKLVKIDLESGKYEEICDAKEKTIIGTYKNNIILEEIVYKEDPEKFLKDDNASIANLRNSIIKISMIDIATKKEIEIISKLYTEMEQITVGTNELYYMTQKADKIEYVNIETKQTGILSDLPKKNAYIQGIYDNKLQYLYYDSQYATVGKAYYIDLDTKENKEFKLFDSNKILVEILAENKDYYFVRTGYEMGKEYTTWAGTKQRDIVKTNYGLIKKEDYWNSIPNYINMQNTDK